MPDIFISYKREDEGEAHAIVAAFRAAGLAVWWDKDIRPNDAWREAIEERLEEARLCLVLWSRASVGKQGNYVKEEAERARMRGAYLGVMIEDVPPAFGFGELQSVALGRSDQVGYKQRMAQLIAVVRARLEGAEAPALSTVLPRSRLVGALAAGAVLLAGGAIILLQGTHRMTTPVVAAAMNAEPTAAGIARFTGRLAHASQVAGNEKLIDFLEDQEGKPVHIGVVLEHGHDNEEAAQAMDATCNRATAGDTDIWQAHVPDHPVRDKLVVLPIRANADHPAAFTFRPQSAIYAAALHCGSGIRMLPMDGRALPLRREADGTVHMVIKGHFAVSRMDRGGYVIYRLKEIDAEEARLFAEAEA